MKNLLILTSVVFVSSMPTPDIEFSTTPASPVTKKITHRNSNPTGTVYIIIDKSDYELNVYDDIGWYATYPVVFGNNSLEDKKMEGDRNTPEGNFKIISKRLHDKWHRFIDIDYPNEESREKFRIRKERGEIPVNARIGGSIGIHGTWPHQDIQIDRFKNWTLGCISMKRSDVDEIYRYIVKGTRVTIRK